MEPAVFPPSLSSSSSSSSASSRSLRYRQRRRHRHRRIGRRQRHSGCRHRYGSRLERRRRRRFPALSVGVKQNFEAEHDI